ncbi:MAG: dNTP triphosphohydrolase [Bacteroidaceae bacterium]|nr:dNTP triphosphohydrolase [Bacteroidaceae bacterium]MBR4782513.1 dNTP triphosphohydrolase [Bacteroidaceae bacterium]
MEWARLISSKRLGRHDSTSEFAEYRSEFQRDYDRLIFSAPFRRLQNKTQVFPLPGSIFVHNRLTHSLEVASVGRSLGNDAARILSQRHPEVNPQLFSQLGTIVSAACLAHDLGNPPFGHSGEKAIATFFSEGKGAPLQQKIMDELSPAMAEIIWQDIIHYDGNANAFRLLTHQYEGRREGGYMMTCSTLASIVKYPYSSLLCGGKSKFGFFQSEMPFFREIADHLGIICKEDDGLRIRYARYPLAYFVEAADDICYEIMDIEDAYKLHIITADQTRELLLNFFEPEQRTAIEHAYPNVSDPNERIIYMRSCVINAIEQECVRVFTDNEQQILRGEFEGSLIRHITPRMRDAFAHCAEFAAEHIYSSREVLDVELAGYKIINTLLELFTDAVVHPDQAYSKRLIERVSSQYQINAPTLHGRLIAVLDYITGMTDVYALDLYRKINGMSLPNI